MNPRHEAAAVATTHQDRQLTAAAWAMTLTAAVITPIAFCAGMWFLTATTAFVAAATPLLLWAYRGTPSRTPTNPAPQPPTGNTLHHPALTAQDRDWLADQLRLAGAEPPRFSRWAQLHQERP